jgi:chemotaxis signal transduction protein
MKALSFFACGEWFAADVGAVSKVARNIGLTPVRAAPGEIAGIAGIKGKVVAMLDLAALRGQKPDKDRARHGRSVNAVVFKGTQDSPDEMGLVIEQPGELLDIDPEQLARSRQESDAYFVAGHCDTGGTLYSIIDVNLITSRFKDIGRQNAAERQRGAGYE